MKHLICRIRRHPLDEEVTVSACPCGQYMRVDNTDPSAATILRVKASGADETDAAIWRAIADYLEEAE